MLRNDKTKVLFGICGNAGHGKDTTAAMLAHRLERCYITSFAGPMKRAAEELFGINPLTTDKDAINPVTGLSVRRTWQLLGTEALRNVFGDGIHTKIADNDIARRGAETVIFTDVRFKNEADYIIENYGTLIHVVDPRKPVLSNHVSEKFAFQFAGYEKLVTHKDQIVHIRNDGTLRELESKVAEIKYSLRLDIMEAQKTRKMTDIQAPADLEEVFKESDGIDSEEIRRMYSLPPIKK